MSVEAPKITDSARRREGLYRSVDAKAHVLADLWKTANNMAVPLVTDEKVIVESESKRLRSVAERLSRLMPDTYQAYLESEILIDQLDFSSYESVWNENDERIQELKERHPEIEFVRFVSEGIEELLDRRDRVRSFQILFGEPDVNGYYLGELERFGELNELPKGLGSAITRVLVGKYSVNLFIDSEVYEKVETFNKDFPTNGMHFGGGSIINVIKDPVPFFYRRKVKFDATETETRLMATVRHEEFHSMEDAFQHDNPDFKIEKNQVETSISHVANGIPIRDENGNTADVIRVNGLDLTKIPDASLEEFLAELASSNERSGVPGSTYAIYTREKKQLISSVFSNPNINRAGVALKILRMLSNEQLKEELEKLYILVDAEIPERRGEVDALFPIFPPTTKLRHVRSTVDRWIKEKEHKPKVS